MRLQDKIDRMTIAKKPTDARLDEVKDDMFDMGGDLFYDAEEDLSFPYEWIQKLYPIRNGINFIRENYIYTPIQLSVTEIGILTSMKIKLDLGNVGEEQ